MDSNRRSHSWQKTAPRMERNARHLKNGGRAVVSDDPFANDRNRSSGASGNVDEVQGADRSLATGGVRAPIHKGSYGHYS
jgi:hypothetical protein